MPSRKKKVPVKKPVKKKKKKKKSRSSILPIILFLVLLFATVSSIFIYNNKDKLETSRLYKQLTETYDKLDEYKDSLSTEEWKAELYFGDESSDFLVTEFRRVSSSDTPERMAAVLIEELIKGPTARGVRTIPDQTEIRSVNIDRQGQLQVDFSRDLSEFHPGGSSSEIMTVFSIVNTLTQNVEEVKSVKILIDGKAIDTIAGHIDCRQPFSSNMKIVR